MREQELAAIRARADAATRGPWVAECTWTAETDLYVAIHTRDKLKKHPWSPRYIAWLMGAQKADVNAHAEPRPLFCKECGYWHHNHRALQVGVDVRDDPETEADASFLAHAREDVPHLLDYVDALRDALAGLLGTDEFDADWPELCARARALLDESEDDRPSVIYDPTLPAKFSITGSCPKCGESLHTEGIMPFSEPVTLMCSKCGSKIHVDLLQEPPKE